TASAPWAWPGSGEWIDVLVALPQREVTGVLLAARIRVRSVLHVIDLLAGQCTVLLVGANIEVHVSRIVGRRVGVAALNELGNQLMHFGDVPGCPWFVGGTAYSQCFVCPGELLLEAVGQGVPFFARPVMRVRFKVLGKG